MQHRPKDLGWTCNCSRHRRSRNDGVRDCLSLWPIAAEVAVVRSGILSRSIPISSGQWHQPHWRNPLDSTYPDVDTSAVVVVVADDDVKDFTLRKK